MNEIILQNLKSRNPQDRLYALELLFDTQDPKALQVFATVYKKDSDPDVRQAALEFGRQLRAAMPSTAYPHKAMPTQKPATVDAKTKQRAKQLLDSSMNALIATDYGRAWAQAKQAFELEPNLRNDAYAIGVAADITGATRPDAVDALFKDDDENEAVMSDTLDNAEKRKRHPTQKRKVGDDVSFGDAMLDVGLYGLISGVVTFALILLMALMMGEKINAIVSAIPESDASTYSMQDMISTIRTVSFVAAVGYGISSAISAVIGLMLYILIIHFIATWLMSGNGSYAAALKETSIPYIAYTVLMAILSAITFVQVLNAFPADPMVYQNSTFVPNIGGALGLLYSGGLLITLIFSVWLAYAIGKAYRFGTGKGCVAIIGSYVLIIGLSCGCYFLIFASIMRNASAY